MPSTDVGKRLRNAVEKNQYETVSQILSTPTRFTMSKWKEIQCSSEICSSEICSKLNLNVYLFLSITLSSLNFESIIIDFCKLILDSGSGESRRETKDLSINAVDPKGNTLLLTAILHKYVFWINNVVPI